LSVHAIGVKLDFAADLHCITSAPVPWLHVIGRRLAMMGQTAIILDAKSAQQ
jgi:hypothetical protein